MMNQVFNAQPTQTKMCYSESGWSCVVFLQLAGICHSIYPGIAQMTKKTFVSKVFFTYCIRSLYTIFFPQSNWWVFFLRAFLQGHHYAFICYIWKPQSEEFLCIHCPPSHSHSVLMTESLIHKSCLFFWIACTQRSLLHHFVVIFFLFL